MLKIKKISDVIGKKVFTDAGDFFGEIEEANLFNNRVESWRVRVGSGFSSIFGGARGVIIPHSYVKSIGDVFVISHLATPSSNRDELPELPEEQM